MRLPGFYYIDKETGRVTDQMAELIHQSDATYSADEIEASLQNPIPAEKSSLEKALEQAAKDRSDLPPRSEAELLKALRQVPEFFHNQGRREELLGLAQRLIVEWGKERAQHWLVGHSPSIDDMDGYFRREPDHISPGSIWPFLRERYGVDLTRHDLGRDVKAAQPLSYGELIEAMLVAAVENEVDHQMELRAETITRFRRTDAQIEAALFKRHTELETGCVSKKHSKALDLTKISGVDWLVPGFLPANDLALLYGEAGTGKTTAALVLARAVLQGTGVLDHEAPAAKGKVLFIASDSGPQPLVAAMQDLGMMGMPEVQCGGEQRFFVWAADLGNESTAWSADLRGCIDLLKFVKEERIDLVVLDSCKAICRGTDVDYSNNHSVTALLTYFKDVVAPHTSLLLLNHDGTARNATAGAKSWKEIPSVVHQLQIEEENGQSRHERRLWQLRKSRLGPLRQFRYQLTDGEPVLCLGEETIGNCKVRLLNVLEDAYRNGETSLSRKELRTRVQLLSPAGGASEKTIDNNLSTATRGKHPEICRAGRGLYKLAPRIAQSLKGSIWDGKEFDQNLVPDCSLSISRRFPDGKSQEVPEDTPPAPEVPEKFPPGNVGKSEAPSHSLRPSEVPPKTHGTLKGVSFAVGDRVQVRTLSGKWNSGWEVDGPVSPQGWVPVRFPLKPEVHTCFPQSDLRLDRSTATA
jgi:KaiC/GvpD/RAD55 family RecA-like ATPase